MSRLKILLPLFFVLSCSAGPTVLSTVPEGGSSANATNLPITATFSAAMDPATLNTTTFTLKQGSTVIPGAVSYSGTTATFTPAAALNGDASLTAKITTGSKDTEGVPMGWDHSWTFTTVADSAPPSASSTKPQNGATNVFLSQRVEVTFNKPMNPSTLTVSSFTLHQGSNAVAGTVSYQASSNTAKFTASAPLDASKVYSASVSTLALSAGGLALTAAHSWTFTTRAASAAVLAVNLGTAGNYVILAKTAISTVPTSAITGNIAVSPAAATYITGFSLTADSTNVFATSPQVTGQIFAADYTSPTPSNLTTAVSDMETAFTDAAGRAPDVTELGAGNIGGMTLVPGVYKWGTGLLIPSDVYLSGSATDVWIFQIAQDLTMASATSVHLAGDALPKNVFWQVSGMVDLDTTAHFEGVVLSQTAITLRTGATINGRLLAQSAVAIDGSTIVQPAP